MRDDELLLTLLPWKWMSPPDWKSYLVTIFVHQSSFSFEPPFSVRGSSSILKRFPTEDLLVRWELCKKEPFRCKMASDRTTECMSCCAHSHTNSNTQSCTLCQLLTEHSGKSQQREQPLCEQERCSLLKRFTAVMLPDPFPPHPSSMVMLIYTSEWDKSSKNRRLAFCCNLTPIFATHWGDDISISWLFTSSLEPILISKAELNLQAALKGLVSCVLQGLWL